MHASHLYVHVPFCARRCVYCDFSIAVRARVPLTEYLGALERELETRHRQSALHLDTLYFGGGTPSKLGGDGVARLTELVSRYATIDPSAEVTLEVNPEDVSPESVRAWKGGGINRVSLGVQSFDDEVLTWMHRTHDARAAQAAVAVVREGGIDNVSIDLIFATPPTLARSWKRDLERALLLEVPHISVYGLTVEPHTPLGRWVARHDVTEAPEDAFEREFIAADEMLASAGLQHYEVSNYGRPGMQSRHNWAYWQRKPYAGIGPSAHEFDGARRRWNTAPYTEWVASLERSTDPVGGSEELESEQVRAEEVYLGLRTTGGVQINDAERDHVSRWVDMGWAELGSNDRVCLSTRGWLRLDSLATDLTHVRSRY